LTEPPGLLAVLAGRARITPDPWLVGLESIGLMIVLAVIVWVPDSPSLALPGVALSMFGLWGVAEHVRQTNPLHRSRAIRVALPLFQLLAVVAGTLAVVGAVYAAAGRLIGTVVS